MGKRLRILFWVPLVNRGGGVRLIVRLVPALARQTEVELVRLEVPPGSVEKQRVNPRGDLPVELSHKASGVRPWWEHENRILGVKGTGWLKVSLDKKLARRRIKKQAKQLMAAAQDCDLIYCFWPHRQAFLEVNKPVVCTIQDTTYVAFPELLGGSEAQVEWRYTEEWVRRSNRVVVSSENTKRWLVKLFGPACESAEVIRHAISPAGSFLGVTEASRLVEGLPRRYVVYPGNTSAQKNHYALFLAWSRFARRNEIPLVLFGEGTQFLRGRGPEWPEHWQLAKLMGLLTRSDLRLNEHYFALGYVDDADASALIANAAALIMPSLAEGGGSFPVEEALSMGVPVLCSDIPVMREHLMQRSAKIAWFDPECPASILAALNTFFDNYEDYKESALRGMKDPRPTWDDVAAQYVNVFARVVEAARNANGSS